MERYTVELKDALTDPENIPWHPLCCHGLSRVYWQNPYRAMWFFMPSLGLSKGEVILASPHFGIFTDYMQPGSTRNHNFGAPTLAIHLKVISVMC